MTTTNPPPKGERSDPAELRRSPRVKRRQLLTAGGIATAAIAGGAIGSAASAAEASVTSDAVEIEVACLGQTWREAVKANPSDDGDFRAPFSVEGLIYPAGTIQGDGFVPTAEGSIGHWICRGYVILTVSRIEPHTSSHQDYLFGLITEQDPFVPDGLSSDGLEGTFHRDRIGTRAVSGGFGEYFGATGQVTQEYFADNTTILADGSGDLSPCFRFNFDLRLPK